MRRYLYLMRHAEAALGAGSSGDFARVLTTRGIGQAAATARWIAAQPHPPEYALVSAAQRTQQTFDVMSQTLAVARRESTPALYDAELETCLSLVQTLPADCSVALIVAHNPGMQELSNVLVTGRVGETRFGMGTASCARLSADLAWEHWAPGVAACEAHWPQD